MKKQILQSQKLFCICVSLIWTIVLILGFSVKINAQAPGYLVPKVTPPSPNAAELGKYGDIPLGLYTGLPNVSIPLYEIKLGNFTLPISLSYHCQGLKVEEKSGNVGLNWSLNAGGVITRSVKGKADEGALGYWGQSTLTNEEISSTGQKASSFCSGALDGQPDMFYFNFGNYSGKFVVDATAGHIAHIIPAQPSIRIKVIDNMSSFEVTDGTGIKYIFDAKETTTDDSSGPPLVHYNSAWYLSSINTPAGTISFTYTNDILTNTQSYAIDHLNNSPGNAAQFNPGAHSGQSSVEIETKVLTTISTPSETIEFSILNDRKDAAGAKRINGLTVKDIAATPIKKYIFNQSYFGNSDIQQTSSCRLKLDQVVELGTDNSLGKAYSLSYNSPEQVPSTLSRSQDYWGFYNGKSNVSLLPYIDPVKYGLYVANQATQYGNREPDANYAQIGCLNQITYPTGGNTHFIYEGNDYSKVSYLPVNEEQYTSKSSLATATKSSSVNIMTTTRTFSINKGQDVMITTQGNYSGPAPVENGPSVFLNRINSDGSKTNILTRYMINSTQNSIQSLSVGNYELIAKVDGVTQTATGKVSYYSADGIFIHKKAAGGVRLKQMISYDPSTTKNMVKEYSYNPDNDPSLSSGVLTSEINLISSKISPTAGYSYTVRNSSSANYLGMTQGSLIGYGIVTEKEGETEQTKKISYFSSAADYPNTLGSVVRAANQNVLTGNANPDYSQKYLNDYDAYRGYLTKEMYYNVTNTLVKQVENIYNLADAGPTSPNYFTMGSKAGMMYTMCSTNVSCGQCTSSTDFINERPETPCDPFIITMFYIFDNKIICPWIYKTQSRETVYDTNGQDPVQTATAYYYENPLHGMVTKTEASNSNGSTIKTINKYAQDKAIIANLSTNASLAIDAMVDKNMVTEVLESEKYNNGNLDIRTRTNYKQWDANGNIVSPENIQTSSLTGAGLEDRVDFYAYDSKGNILSLGAAGGAKSVLIWSYNLKYPIAEIKNTDVATVESVLGGTTVINDFSVSNPTDQQVNNFINLLRSASQLKDAQITSYTYKPLVGMTSSTDAKGQTTYYEYDAFQRLKTIKDQNGNILKQTDYHYKN